MCSHDCKEKASKSRTKTNTFLLLKILKYFNVNVSTLVYELKRRWGLIKMSNGHVILLFVEILLTYIPPVILHGKEKRTIMQQHIKYSLYRKRTLVFLNLRGTGSGLVHKAKSEVKSLFCINIQIYCIFFHVTFCYLFLCVVF